MFPALYCMLKSIQECEPGSENWALVPLVNLPEEQPYVAASFPELFCCTQNPICTPTYTTAHNSFFIKSEFLLLATELSSWEGEDASEVYPNSRLCFCLSLTKHIYIHTHLIPLLFSLTRNSASKDFVTKFSRQFGNKHVPCLFSSILLQP